MKKEFDITGRRYGKLLVLKLAGKNRHKQFIWHCKCDCGNKTIALGTCLRAGRIKSCGCYHKEMMSKLFLKDLTGKRIGRLVVLYRTKKDDVKYAWWKCRCDCGNVVSVSSRNLNNDVTKSCGCLHRDIVSKEPFRYLFNHLKQTAYKNGNAMALAFEDFLEFTKRTVCHYCGKTIKWYAHATTKNYRYNLDRMDNSIGYCKDNLAVCCPECNRMKGTLSYHYFYNFTRPIRERWQPI